MFDKPGPPLYSRTSRAVPLAPGSSRGVRHATTAASTGVRATTRGLHVRGEATGRRAAPRGRARGDGARRASGRRVGASPCRSPARRAHERAGLCLRERLAGQAPQAGHAHRRRRVPLPGRALLLRGLRRRSRRHHVPREGARPAPAHAAAFARLEELLTKTGNGKKLAEAYAAAAHHRPRAEQAPLLKQAAVLLAENGGAGREGHRAAAAGLAARAGRRRDPRGRSRCSTSRPTGCETWSACRSRR